MKKEYEEPSFEVVEYEIEDIITMSGLFGDKDPDGGDWWG